MTDNTLGLIIEAVLGIFIISIFFTIVPELAKINPQSSYILYFGLVGMIIAIIFSVFASLTRR